MSASSTEHFLKSQEGSLSHPGAVVLTLRSILVQFHSLLYKMSRDPHRTICKTM